MKKHLDEIKRLQKIAGILKENVNEADDDSDLDPDADPDSDPDFEDFAKRAADLLKPNPEPPVWKSILASDKKTLALIDKKIKELYPGAKKLPGAGDPVSFMDKEMEETIPIAVYSWQDPDKPKEVEGDPGAIIPEDPEEAQEFYNEYDGDGDLIPWITHIIVQKEVESGDIGYWEILVNGDTNDPWESASGWLTGEFAEDPIYKIATAGGLPKGTTGGFNSDNKYGDRTNE